MEWLFLLYASIKKENKKLDAITDVLCIIFAVLAFFFTGFGIIFIILFIIYFLWFYVAFGEFIEKLEHKYKMPRKYGNMWCETLMPMISLAVSAGIGLIIRLGFKLLAGLV